jgi:hypothetical protein
MPTQCAPPHYVTHINGYAYTVAVDPSTDLVHFWKDDIAPPMPLHLVIPAAEITKLQTFVSLQSNRIR